jgi:predicted transcriptional regulator
MTVERILSNMSARELQRWRKRYDHSLDSGAEALGVSTRMFAHYLAGTKNIPLTIAILCDAIDELEAR